VVGSLVGLVLAGVRAVPLVRRRRSAASGERPAVAQVLTATGEAALAAAAAESLADLRVAGDVRREIIACYVQMERALRRAGLARRPSEAPLEYLGRVLMPVAPAAGRSLTELFERAAFSVEPLGVSERERAIDALKALRSATS
jgi:Domain of unknown function (DUF4129)